MADRHRDPLVMTELLTVEQATDAVIAAIEPLAAVEVDIGPDALGLILAAAVTATTDLPPWDNSAMDGYAIRSGDVARATEAAPVRLLVIGEVAAGQAPDTEVQPRAAVRIATGAPLPAGADAVVPVESTTPLDAEDHAGARGRDASGPLPPACLVHESIAPGAHIRRRGGDLRAGDQLLAPGRMLTPAAIGLAAGGGVPRISVRPRPRVAVLATGDEVRRPGEPLGPAGIPDANGPGLAALVAGSGAIPVRLGIAPDRLDVVEAAVRRALAEADALIVSGGVSVGPYDVVKLAFEAVGHVDLWRVAVQPGKPFAFGVAQAPDGRRIPLFGLPGNPVSGFVVFDLFVRPAIDRLAGRSTAPAPLDRGVLVEPATKRLGRRAYLRVIAERDTEGRPVRDADDRVRVRLAGGQGSHVLSSLAAADALAVVPEALAEVEAGSTVGLRWLDR
ncbi:MAG TPA: gephyrin-like molybdotransferase Glp [Candidatus Dormibacteraeota bacterium]|nr:gephyrin-like molybdotransferase Glp [Candidatus Dormibacteraeota bacterium]